jgi:hypothetical protein
MILALSLCQSATRLMPRLCATVAETWRTVKNDLFDRYRPERHYMRGPGPKFRAKHAKAQWPSGKPMLLNIEQTELAGHLQ